MIKVWPELKIKLPSVKINETVARSYFDLYLVGQVKILAMFLLKLLCKTETRKVKSRDAKPFQLYLAKIHLLLWRPQLWNSNKSHLTTLFSQLHWKGIPPLGLKDGDYGRHLCVRQECCVTVLAFASLVS